MRVSILMSVFNEEEYIEETLRSLLNQTYDNCELVIIDDCSTDRSVELIKSLDDKRIKLFRNETNLGLTKSLNVGLGRCRGEYIARADGNDLHFPDRLEKQAHALDRQPDLGMISCNYYVINPDDSLLGRTVTICSWNDLYRHMLNGNRVPGPFATFRRSLINELGGYDERYLYSQDYELALRIGEKSKIEVMAEPLAIWIITGTGVTSRKRKDQRRCAIRAAAAARKRGYYPRTPRYATIKCIGKYHSGGFPNRLEIEKHFNILKEFELTNYFFRSGPSDLLDLNASFDRQIDRWIAAGKKRIMLFGAGQHTRNLMDRVDFGRMELVAAADNNRKIWGKRTRGIKIVPPHSINELRPDVIIISSAYHEEEMIHQLQEMRLTDVEIFPIYTNRFLNFYSWLETGFFLSRWRDARLYAQSIKPGF